MLINVIEYQRAQIKPLMSIVGDSDLCDLGVKNKLI